ncbi:hypothetical protein L6R46_12655 [Myxococcota bacterium]|nr:hypothetical protein [Myxococcota bacterium]
MDKLRALFVLFHLVGITLLSLPSPGKAQDLDAPEAAALLADLRALGARIGVERSAAEVKAIALGVSERVRAARATLLAPFNPYARLTGAKQGWSMFWAINHRPARLVIELEGPDGVWTPLYVARSDVYAWRRREMDQERVRGLVNQYSHLRDRRSYRAFAAFIAQRALAEHPEAQRARVLMEERPSLSPEALRAGKTPPSKRRWEELYSRETP